MPLKKSTGNMYPWVTHTHSLTASQRASIAINLLPKFQEEAKERKGAKSHFAHVSRIIGEDEKGRAADN